MTAWFCMRQERMRVGTPVKAFAFFQEETKGMRQKLMKKWGQGRR